MSQRKIFSEQELAALVRRAAELQEAAKEPSTYTPGVTREELERVTAEMGIDSRYLEQAVREMNSPESKKGPLHLTEEFERVVEGELRTEDFDLILAELKPEKRRDPLVQIGRTLTGSMWTGCSQAALEVTARNGRTKIKVKSSPLMAWLMSIHPATLISLALVGSMSARGLLVPALAIVAVLLLVASLAFKFLLQKGHDAARRKTDRIEAVITDATADVRGNLAGVTPVQAEAASSDVTLKAR